LKPLRDFFLILFFFSLGAQLNIGLLSEVIAPALLLAALALSLKPIVFRYLLRRFSERNRLAWDAGLRLGQISEFSLLIAFVATQSGVIGELASLTIQAAAIVSFLISSYIVVFFCPTPIAINSKLRRD
jgi:Kef-type K+ transport system membrane component KefB